MLKQQQRSSERASVVVSPMDDTGRMELRDVETDEIYEVVDYIDDELATKLGALSAGEAVNLELLAGSGTSDGFGAVRIESTGPSARFK
ncbi:hypothetical protein NDI54_12385 [Haloarcula sp. S1AR25-5A]|uniref:DUF7999 domain-containing protein n=1 Tax=Haloarcula terrestris TaxID=2950533 RepID=A0AAE4F0A7_9EURY|nr:hypothetical protein [Haloarcula terrestris]MDS0222148.1 hypothetical protein [Haloarcula terrestris]